MLYFFFFLILVGVIGILFLILRRRLFGNKTFNLSFLVTAVEQYWIRRIKRSPKDHRLYKKLAGWYIRNKKREDAIQALEYAIKLKPDDKEAQVKLEKMK